MRLKAIVQLCGMIWRRMDAAGRGEWGQMDVWPRFPYHVEHMLCYESAECASEQKEQELWQSGSDRVAWNGFCSTQLCIRVP